MNTFLQKALIDPATGKIQYNELGLLESENCSQDFLNFVNFTRPWLTVLSGTSYGLLSHLSLDNHVSAAGRFIRSLDFILQNTNNYCFRGTLESIGTDEIAPDWASAKGHWVLVTAEGENWFSIKNNGTPLVNTKKILTRHGKDLNFISKAFFSYSADADAYIVVAYATKVLWHKRYTWSAIPEGQPDINGYYTFVTDTGVPFNNCFYWGYARLPFNASRIDTVPVQYGGGQSHPAGGGSTLSLAQEGGGSEEVLAVADKGWCIEGGGTSGIYIDADVGVTELKGGAVIHVSGAGCVDRKLQLKVKIQDTLENFGFDDMRLDVWLLNDQDGHACYDN